MGKRVLSPRALLDLDDVSAFANSNGLRNEHVRTVLRAVAKEGSTSMGGDVPPACVAALSDEFAVSTSSVREAVETSAQKGFKLVVALQDGHLVETVAIVHESSTSGVLQGRITVCVSSQVGCKMGCTFCATGTMGFLANLTAGEICEQVWHVERQAPAFGLHWRVTNVVFMGMGEPLNNYAAVVSAIRCMREAFELAPSRITVSTVGVVNRMRSLARDAPGVSLALSLHAATQETRVKLVPSSAAYTVDKLTHALDDYCEASGRGVMIEYILIAGVNDSNDEARALATLLRGRQVVLNLIPYNETKAGEAHGYKSPSAESLRVSVRWSSAFARDVAGACGQLALESGGGSAGGAAEGRPSSKHAASGAGRRSASSGQHADVEDLATGAATARPSLASRIYRSLVGEAPLHPEAQAQLAAGVPTAYLPLFERQSFAFDARGGPEASRHLNDLTSALTAALRLSDVSELATLSARAPDAPCIPALQHALLCAGVPLPAAQKRAGASAWLGSDERKRFLAAYERLVRAVVLPRMDALSASGRCVCQAEPTIRISLPGSRAPGGRPRSSSEFFHPAGELCFWLPLTPSAGSSAMHVATSTGADADMVPLALAPGEGASWWGHGLRSGLLTNSSDASVVGLQFDVIPWALYKESREATRRSSHDLRLGGYYQVMQAEPTAADPHAID